MISSDILTKIYRAGLKNVLITKFSSISTKASKIVLMLWSKIEEVQRLFKVKSQENDTASSGKFEKLQHKQVPKRGTAPGVRNGKLYFRCDCFFQSILLFYDIPNQLILFRGKLLFNTLSSRKNWA